MKKIMILAVLLIIVQGCSQNKKEKPNPEIEKTLERQIKNGANKYSVDADIEVPRPEFSNEDLDATIFLAKDILASSGYKSPENEDFKNKIQLVFGRVIDYKLANNLLYVNYIDKCNHEFNKNPNNVVDNNGTYIVKNENFITDFYYIPELVKYKEVCPKAAAIEQKISKKYKDRDNNSYTIETWDDLEKNKDTNYNLEIQRKKNILIVINRNKYLFNDNKESLTWLKSNDTDFLESLVKTFGYVQDKDLLKWVIEKKAKTSEEYGKLIWHKTCDGKFIFHNETLNVMKLNNSAYIDNLINYLKSLDDNAKTDPNLKFEDKAIIIANILNFSSQIAQNDSKYKTYLSTIKDYYTSMDKAKQTEIDNEFKRNNYYKFANLKTYWEQIKTNSDGLSDSGNSDTKTGSNCGSKKQAIQIISELKETQKQQKNIESISNNKKGVSYMTENKTIKNQEYFAVSTGYDGKDRWETYTTFYVNKKNCNEIYVSDDVSGDIISLAQWRKLNK